MADALNEQELHPEQMGNLTPVRLIEHLEDEEAFAVSVTNTSNDIATLTGTTIPADVVAITMQNIDNKTVFYQSNGTDADIVGSGSPIGFYTAYGDKAKLDNIRLIADGTAQNFGIIYHKLVSA